MRRIVLPQAMRVIVPPTGNETISMLKTTSLRLHRHRPSSSSSSRSISNFNYRIIELLIVEHLVPGDVLGAHRLPVLHRAPLCAGSGAGCRPRRSSGSGMLFQFHAARPAVRRRGRTLHSAPICQSPMSSAE